MIREIKRIDAGVTLNGNYCVRAYFGDDYPISLYYLKGNLDEAVAVGLGDDYELSLTSLEREALEEAGLFDHASFKEGWKSLAWRMAREKADEILSELLEERAIKCKFDHEQFWLDMQQQLQMETVIYVPEIDLRELCVADPRWDRIPQGIYTRDFSIDEIVDSLERDKRILGYEWESLDAKGNKFPRHAWDSEAFRGILKRIEEINKEYSALSERISEWEELRYVGGECCSLIR